MPGFLMHLVEGEMILNHVVGRPHTYETAERQFMLGCILPDITTDKEKTHFRPNSQAHQINKYPDMEYVLATYQTAALSPIDLGILAHLQMDAGYVTEFWPQHFEFQKKDGTPSTDMRNALFVKVFRQPERRIPLQEFFSMNYFYGDYDIINPILYREFHPFLPVDVAYQEHDIHIKECIPESPDMINDMLKTYVTPEHAASGANVSHTASGSTSPVPTKVLPYPDILSFLKQEANRFVRLLS